VEFRLLGPLEVDDDGRPVAVGAGKRRALLAILLLHSNEVVSADRLIADLWGERPPATVAKSLHVYVSQLRKELGHGNGSGESILRTFGGGYVAVVAGDDVDTHRFERLLADGRRAAEAEDPRRASDALAQAIALWRGEPLSDFAYEPFAQREIARLSELRLVAHECRIDADLELGRHGAVVGELEVLVDEHPLRERLRAQLMLALYRCGRQAEALDTYRDGRTRLVADLGLEPGRALRELESSILEQSPELDPPARRPAAPARPPTARPPPGDDGGEVSAPSAAAAPRGRRLPARIVVLMVSGTVLLSAAGLAVLAETGERKSPGRSPPALDLARSSVALIDAGGGAVRFAAPLPGRPTGLATTGDTVWTTTVDSAALVGVDIGTRSIVRTVPLRIRPDAVALGEGAAWVVDGGRGMLVRVEPGYEEVSDAIRFRPRGRSQGGAPASAVVADGGVWITDGSTRLVRVDAVTRSITTVEFQRPLTGAAAGAGAIWAISDDPPSVIRVDPSTRSATDRLPLVTRQDEAAPTPVGIAAGASAVWVLNSNTATVTRVDPVTRGVSATIPIGVDRVPNAIATDGTRAWVANEDGTLSRIDPGASAAASIWVGESLRQVAASGSRLWVATAALDQQLPGGGG
jgi:DNA-binding SARP family transcriptional activator